MLASHRKKCLKFDVSNGDNNQEVQYCTVMCIVSGLCQLRMALTWLCSQRRAGRSVEGTPYVPD